MDSKQNIVLYTHKGCLGGDRAISYFHENGILVEVKDIANDPHALNEFRRHGYFATPVLIINGREFIGFDEEEVAQLLGQGQKLKSNNDGRNRNE